MPTASSQIHLVSVNNTPPKAKELVSNLAANLKHQYHLIHVANSETISGLEPLLVSLVTPPKLLICSSQWEKQEQIDIVSIAKAIFPDIAVITIPAGLYASKGDNAVVEFLEEEVKKSGLPKI